MRTSVLGERWQTLCLARAFPLDEKIPFASIPANPELLGPFLLAPKNE